MSLLRTAIAGFAFAAVAIGPAYADDTVFEVTLTADEVVPPTNSTGIAEVTIMATPETGDIVWLVIYEGLSSRITSVEFHGPAGPGETAPITQSIRLGLTSPIIGGTMLSDAGMAALLEGMWYVEIQTADFPDGELRGQLIVTGTEPDTFSE